MNEMNKIILEFEDKIWKAEIKAAMDLCDELSSSYEMCPPPEDEVIIIEEPEVINDGNDIIELNIDNEKWTSKPQGVYVGAIQKRLAKSKQKITIRYLADAIYNGQSFKVAALNGAKNSDWVSQQIFALDIDNKGAEIEQYGYLTIEEAIERCKRYGIKPAFIYESFSSTEEIVKFRIVFVMDEVITDRRDRTTVQMALMRIFPESDPACKDYSRLFFGSNHKVHPIDNFSGRISKTSVIFALIAKLKDDNKETGHFSRDIKNFCQQYALDMFNGLPKMDGNNYIYAANEYVYDVTRAKDTDKKVAKFNINCDRQKLSTIKNFDWEVFEEKCPLWADLMAGEYVHHEEIFGLASNLYDIQGSESRFVDAVMSNKNYSQYKKANKINTYYYNKKMEYAPQRCENFCPYYNNGCSNSGLNCKHVMDIKRGQIRIVEDTVTRNKDDVRADLKDVFNDITKDYQPSINVIKAPTGIGKTEILKSLDNYNNTVIAAPTHKLAKEIYERLGVDGWLVEDFHISDESVNEEVSHLLNIGCYKEAYNIIHEYCNMLYSLGTVDADMEAKKLSDWLTTNSNIKNTNKLIVCTHAKMLQLNNKNVKRFIVDEDIIMSALFKTVSLSLNNIKALADLAAEHYPITSAALEELFEKMMNTKNGSVHSVSKIYYDDNELADFVSDNRTVIDFNLKDALSIDQITVDKYGHITGSKQERLPMGQIIIMSATANEQIYNNWFDVNFYDLGLADMEGKIIHHNHGFSRTYLSGNTKKAIEIIKNEVENMSKNIITFKSYETAFNKAGFKTICNYGATTGIDAYGGQDLTVVGTPYVNEAVFGLFYSYTCGVNEIPEMTYQSVINNGFEFSINTYDDNEARMCQFYMIESELVQAVGRARALNNDCTVHVFSSYPLAGSFLN